MAFDGIVLNCVVNELNSEIIGAKVNKIFEPSRSDIIFGLYNHGKSYSFLINIQPEIARFHLTTYNKPNPLQAPNFCMLLRKHLMNAKIVAINTFDLERVIEIVFESYNELKDIVVKKIFVETMPSHSNVILTNSQNTIIDALRHVSNNSLEIIPARQYKIPSNKKHSILKIKNGSEFLKYIPKEAIDTLFVYETVPTCELKYIIEVEKIVEYRNKINELGYGNADFNAGLKQSKYAYEIKHVDLLENPIGLKELKDVYGFAPPQSYAYDDRYVELTNDIKLAKVKRLI